MRAITRAAAYAVLFAAAGGAQAQTQGWDGTYLCQMYMGGMTMNFGDLVISKGRYKGFSGEGAVSIGPVTPPNGEAGVVFNGTTPGIPAGYSIQGAAAQRTKDGGATMSIYVQSARSGNSTQLLCTRGLR